MGSLGTTHFADSHKIPNRRPTFAGLCSKRNSKKIHFFVLLLKFRYGRIRYGNIHTTMGNPAFHFFVLSTFDVAHAGPDENSAQLVKDLSNLEKRMVATKELLMIGWPAYRHVRDAASKNEEFARTHRELIRELREQAIEKSVVYVFGVYRSAAPDQEVAVEVSKFKSPVRLVLTSYKSVDWKIRTEGQCTIIDVHLSGYFLSKTNFPGASATAFVDQPDAIAKKTFFCRQSR
jgi:hypothetical protein